MMRSLRAKREESREQEGFVASMPWHVRLFADRSPAGFNAGDANLYSYVGNDPTNATDPSGLYGVFFDGWRYHLTDKTIIGRLYNAYQGHATYYEMPEGGMHAAVEDAITRVLAAVKANKNEPIDIFGWSRGGVAALVLANELDKLGIKIRFLGVIDPTAPALILENKAIRAAEVGKLGDNVKEVVILHRDGKADDANERKNFKVKIPVVGMNTTLAEIKNDPARPLTHVRTGFARYFGIELWKKAVAAGVPLPKVEDSPFWDKKYSSKPVGLSPKILDMLSEEAPRPGGPTGRDPTQFPFDLTPHKETK